MFIAHGPVSYLANEVIQKKKILSLKPSQQIFLTASSFIFGILPDLDFLLLMMGSRPSYSHHDLFTHTPFYWIALWLVLSLVVRLIYSRAKRKTKDFFTKDFLNILLNAFLIAGISHFFADLLVGNIMILYPFSTRHFTLLKYLFEPSYFTGYFLSVYFAIELIIIVVALVSLSKKFLKKVKWDDIVVYVLLCITSSYLLFTIVLNTKTYNKSFLGDSSKPYTDYDVDFDTLRDTEDMDVDNDGVDNILDVEEERLVSSLRGIVDSNKITASSWITSKFGGLSSYRLISQAYFESSSPIEPVLKDFYIKSMDVKKYSVDIDYQEMLQNYLLSKDLLINLNLNGNPILAQGKIFFLLDENEKILNMGMTMENNQVAIVLPGEEFVQYHTYDGIRLFYEDIISTFQICL